MTGGKMISQSGAMFYCTNTSSVVNLRSAELVLSDTGDLLIVSAGRWGKDGKNGGKCVFNAEDQTLEGNITVDSIPFLVALVITVGTCKLDKVTDTPRNYDVITLDISVLMVSSAESLSQRRGNAWLFTYH